MSVALALPLFAVSLTVTLAAARLFARRLDVLGVRFGFPEALVGLLTALAADGPEISSAAISLARCSRGACGSPVLCSRSRGVRRGCDRAGGRGSARRAHPGRGGDSPRGGCGSLSAHRARRQPACRSAASAGPDAGGNRERSLWPERSPHGGCADRGSPAPDGDGDLGHALILLGSAGMVQSAVALGNHWGASGTLDRKSTRLNSSH